MNFFDPNSHSSLLFAMGSPGHLALVLILAGLVALLLASRKHLGALRESRAFIEGTAAFILSIEALSYLFKILYPCNPAYERLPLHLCATLKIALTVLILARRYDLVKYVAIAAIGCGGISFANLNLNGGSFENFAFWHYLFGHYYLVLAPVFLFLTGDLRFRQGDHLRAMLGLFAWSLVIFFVNWGFDVNYMYTGPHNDASVPFIPARMMIWPLNYVSYLLVGMVLLNGVYAVLRVGPGARLKSVAIST